jgi:hypothetical protein
LVTKVEAAHPDFGAPVLGGEQEVGGVVGFKGLDEVELNAHLVRRGGLDLHAAAAHVLVALPTIGGAHAGRRAAKGALHGGVELLPG